MIQNPPLKMNKGIKKWQEKKGYQHFLFYEGMFKIFSNNKYFKIFLKFLPSMRPWRGLKIKFVHSAYIIVHSRFEQLLPGRLFNEVAFRIHTVIKGPHKSCVLLLNVVVDTGRLTGITLWNKCNMWWKIWKLMLY